MTRRGRCWRVATLSVVASLIAAIASAQIVQSVHIGAGRFFPRGFDSRDAGDTLVADLTIDPTLAFDISGFRATEFFIEWTMQIGNRFEFGAGLSGFRSPRVLSGYRFPPVNGRNAGQMLRLTVVPVVGVVRYFPIGTPQTVQPFVGAGIGGARWKYSESGEFFDPSDNSFFTDNFEARGGAPVRVMLFGLRVPGPGKYAFNFEWRYQYGAGRTGGLQAGFLGEKFDLGGGSIRIGYMGRF